MKLFQRPDTLADSLHVLTSVYNPHRYRSRWKLYEDFKAMCDRAGAVLHTVEIALGEREFVLGDIAGENYLQLRTWDELWIKENALNLIWQQLPLNWKYAGWLDADVTFARKDWADEIRHSLQHYMVVQPFSEARELGPNHNILNSFKSFAYCYKHGLDTGKCYYSGGGGKGTYPHPGLGMFFRREAFDNLGGLIDWGILGGGDTYMWMLLAGIMRKHLPDSLGSAGKDMLKIWGERCNTFIKQDIGYVEGLLLHYWHGNKAHRGYLDRGQILVKAKFDPRRDIYRDFQGLYQLNPNNIALRDGIRNYFKGRNEDSVDII